jgi:hypothetical protein
MFLFSIALAADPAPRHDLRVVWSADGTHLQVGNAVHEAATGTVRRLPPDWRYSALSPDGRSSARIADDTLTVLGRGLPFRVPTGDAIVSWLADDRLLVVQREDLHVYTCATVRVGVAALTPVPCPKGQMHQLYGVVPGPGDLLAVQSSGEGHPAVDLIRWTPLAQEAVRTPNIDLYPYGPAHPSFAEGRLWLHTPCDLREPRGCPNDGIGGRAPTFVFTVQPDTDAPVLHREGVPAGLAYDAVHDRFGWAEGEQWCVGDLRAPPRCRDR